MTATLSPDNDTLARPDPALARTTGLLYLGLGITGMLGLLLIRPQLFDADDPAATLNNLVANEALARTGIALELALVLTQVLAALWFYRFFRPVDSFAAGAIAPFCVPAGLRAHSAGSSSSAGSATYWALSSGSSRRSTRRFRRCSRCRPRSVSSG